MQIRRTKQLVLILAVCSLFVTGSVSYLSKRWKIASLHDYQEYSTVFCFLPGEDLWFDRFQSGDDVASFTVFHPPDRIEQFGSYTVLSYFPKLKKTSPSFPQQILSVIVKDGRLLQAVAIGDSLEKTFFRMNTDEAESFQRASDRLGKVRTTDLN